MSTIDVTIDLSVWLLNLL